MESFLVYVREDDMVHLKNQAGEEKA